MVSALQVNQTGFPLNWSDKNLCACAGKCAFVFPFLEAAILQHADRYNFKLIKNFPFVTHLNKFQCDGNNTHRNISTEHHCLTLKIKTPPNA